MVLQVKKEAVIYEEIGEGNKWIVDNVQDIVHKNNGHDIVQ